MTFDELIPLAENGTPESRDHYGTVLSRALRAVGAIVRLTHQGPLLYSADLSGWWRRDSLFMSTKDIPAQVVEMLVASSEPPALEVDSKPSALEVDDAC